MPRHSALPTSLFFDDLFRFCDLFSIRVSDLSESRPNLNALSIHHVRLAKPQRQPAPNPVCRGSKRLGVNLDAADATNSPLFGAVKRVNSNSLFGGPTYEAAKANNTSALTGSTNSFLDKIYPGDRESGGADIQKALKANQQGFAIQGNRRVRQPSQDISVPGLEDVGKTAQDMAAQNSAYQGPLPIPHAEEDDGCRGRRQRPRASACGADSHVARGREGTVSPFGHSAPAPAAAELLHCPKAAL